MSKFRKTVVVDAVQWDGMSDTANEFIGDRYGVDWEYIRDDSSSIYILSLRGRNICTVGNWIIKGVEGELSLCREDVFAVAYEAISEQGE